MLTKWNNSHFSLTLIALLISRVNGAFTLHVAARPRFEPTTAVDPCKQVSHKENNTKEPGPNMVSHTINNID